MEVAKQDIIVKHQVPAADGAHVVHQLDDQGGRVAIQQPVLGDALLVGVQKVLSQPRDLVTLAAECLDAVGQ